MQNETRSFIVGIAIDCSIEAALIYDDLAFAQRTVGEGEWFFRSYEQLLNRLPFMSERTARTAIRKLESAGLIVTKIKKDKMGVTKCHYQICRTGTAKIADPIQSAKIAEPINKQLKETTINGARSKEFLSELIALVNPKEKPTADRVRVLNGRLKDYSEEEITNAATAFSKSEWHRENKQMSIDNLLAPSKFGRWYDQGVAAKPALDKRVYG